MYSLQLWLFELYHKISQKNSRHSEFSAKPLVGCAKIL